MKANVLVVANRTAASPDLIACLRERAERSPARFELLIPPMSRGDAGRAEARENLEAALRALGDAGLDVSGRVAGDPDPVYAVVESYDPRRHDEVVISTLPASTSHWLRVDGPARIARQTGALVRHVESRPPKPPAPTREVQRRPGQGVLTPFAALGYGGRRPAAH